ncbi:MULTISPECIES: hypothetical protein [Anaerotruncus]|jgi:hypothetical protein|uniref:hypothetical protein n=1 Tax=Anaerotruncus TaxID=244127 RepID=UPI00082AE89A|nr:MULTISPECIES: hypothetical protein [Anaerotruncus]RGX53452.1 hypothetical protein DWV16_16780 [Anaerotruncus sp. AF02-27]
MAEKGKKPCDAQLSPQAKNRVSRVVSQMISTPPSHTDPNGSYTGKPLNYGEVPVQDADDL